VRFDYSRIGFGESVEHRDERPSIEQSVPSWIMQLSWVLLSRHQNWEAQNSLFPMSTTDFRRKVPGSLDIVSGCLLLYLAMKQVLLLIGHY
jgi:hypothetical protein